MARKGAKRLTWVKGRFQKWHVGRSNHGKKWDEHKQEWYLNWSLSCEGNDHPTHGTTATPRGQVQPQYKTVTIQYNTIHHSFVNYNVYDFSQQIRDGIFWQESQIFFYHWYLKWFIYIIYRLPLPEKFVTEAIYTNLVPILSHRVTSLTHNYLLLKFHG